MVDDRMVKIYSGTVEGTRRRGRPPYGTGNRVNGDKQNRQIDIDLGSFLHFLSMIIMNWT